MSRELNWFKAWGSCPVDSSKVILCCRSTLFHMRRLLRVLLFLISSFFGGLEKAVLRDCGIFKLISLIYLKLLDVEHLANPKLIIMMQQTELYPKLYILTSEIYFI